MSNPEACRVCKEPGKNREAIAQHEADMAKINTTIEDFRQQIEDCSLWEKFSGRRAMLRSGFYKAKESRALLVVQSYPFEQRAAAIIACNGPFVREIPEEIYEVQEDVCGADVQSDKIRRITIPYPKD